MGVDRPSHHFPGMSIENHTAVDVSFAGWVLGDVSRPELIGGVAPELALNQVLQSCHVDQVFPMSSQRKSSEPLGDHEPVHGLPGNGNPNPSRSSARTRLYP